MNNLSPTAAQIYEAAKLALKCEIIFLKLDQVRALLDELGWEETNEPITCRHIEGPVSGLQCKPKRGSVTRVCFLDDNRLKYDKYADPKARLEPRFELSEDNQTVTRKYVLRFGGYSSKNDCPSKSNSTVIKFVSKLISRLGPEDASHQLSEKLIALPSPEWLDKTLHTKAEAKEALDEFVKKAKAALND